MSRESLAPCSFHVLYIAFISSRFQKVYSSLTITSHSPMLHQLAFDRNHQFADSYFRSPHLIESSLKLIKPYVFSVLNSQPHSHPRQYTHSHNLHLLSPILPPLILPRNILLTYTFLFRNLAFIAQATLNIIYDLLIRAEDCRFMLYGDFGGVVACGACLVSRYYDDTHFGRHDCGPV